MTANLAGLPTAWATAKAIRARIVERTGLTASAGISYNKLLAKLASSHRKPNGQFPVTPDMGAAWVETLPIARFHGIGPVTAARMRRLGIAPGRICAPNLSHSCKPISAAPPTGITRSRAARTTARSIRTACANRPVRKRRSTAT